MKRLKCIIQFNVKFLPRSTCCRKVLVKMPDATKLQIYKINLTIYCCKRREMTQNQYDICLLFSDVQFSISFLLNIHVKIHLSWQILMKTHFLLYRKFVFRISNLMCYIHNKGFNMLHCYECYQL